MYVIWFTTARGRRHRRSGETDTMALPWVVYEGNKGSM